MTTIYVQGSINAPTAPNTQPGIYGYDNGGFFGPVGGNLGGAEVIMQWTGTDCNCYGGPGVPTLGGPISPITNVILTVNGISLDITQYNNIWYSEWLEAPGDMRGRIMERFVNDFYDYVTREKD